MSSRRSHARTSYQQGFYGELHICYTYIVYIAEARHTYYAAAYIIRNFVCTQNYKRERVTTVILRKSYSTSHSVRGGGGGDKNIHTLTM